MNDSTTTQPGAPAAPPGPADLTARLEAWITGQGIKGNYDTPGIAARVVAQSHPGNLTRWLEQDSPYLRHMCANVKDFADLTRGEFVTESVRHGNRGLVMSRVIISASGPEALRQVAIALRGLNWDVLGEARRIPGATYAGVAAARPALRPVVHGATPIHDALAAEWQQRTVTAGGAA